MSALYVLLFTFIVSANILISSSPARSHCSMDFSAFQCFSSTHNISLLFPVFVPCRARCHAMHCGSTMVLYTMSTSPDSIGEYAPNLSIISFTKCISFLYSLGTSDFPLHKIFSKVSMYLRMATR